MFLLTINTNYIVTNIIKSRLFSSMVFGNTNHYTESPYKLEAVLNLTSVVWQSLTLPKIQ